MPLRIFMPHLKWRSSDSKIVSYLYVYSNGSVKVLFEVIIQQYSVQKRDVPAKSTEELERQIAELMSEETLENAR